VRQFEGDWRDLPNLYLFLLLATRTDMRRDRLQDRVDGTALFEQVCAWVAERFWGGPSPNVKSVVFGTGRLCSAGAPSNREAVDQGRFQSMIGELCQRLGEGVGFLAKGDWHVTARDGKLDVVVWRSFADRRPGQLIGFGQCKTGTYWHEGLTTLQPGDFCAKWMIRRPAVLPVRLYFVADRVKARWADRCTDAGVLFDRCRIMEYASDLPPHLATSVRTWVRASISSHGLRLP
jgi:hypothetical protein